MEILWPLGKLPKLKIKGNNRWFSVLVNFRLTKFAIKMSIHVVVNFVYKKNLQNTQLNVCYLPILLSNEYLTGGIISPIFLLKNYQLF